MPKYKIGQPVVAWDIRVDQESREEVPILGVIVENDESSVDGFSCFIMWSDGEEDWYSSSDVKMYIKQAKTGKQVNANG